jgi:hypothetical protein
MLILKRKKMMRHSLITLLLIVGSTWTLGCSKVKDKDQSKNDKEVSSHAETMAEETGSKLSLGLSEGFNLASGRYNETAYVLEAKLTCGSDVEVLTFTKADQSAILYKDLTACTIELLKFGVERGEPRPIEPLVYEATGQFMQNSELFKTIAGHEVDSKLVMSMVSIKERCEIQSTCNFMDVLVTFKHSELLREEVELLNELTVAELSFEFEQEKAPCCDVKADFELDNNGIPELILTFDNCKDINDFETIEFAIFEKKWSEIYTLEGLHEKIDAANKSFTTTGAFELRLSLEDLKEIAGSDDVFEALSMDLVIATRNKDGKSIKYYVIDNTCEPFELVERLNNQIKNFSEQSWSVRHPGEGGSSYFSVDGLLFDSVESYLAWCIDTDRTINPGTTYEGTAYSSYDLDLIHRLGLVENTSALPMVNWILNQGFVGTDAPGTLGTFTYGDVQAAIWDLIDNSRGNGLGSISNDRIDYIKAQAALHPDFTPSKDGVVGVILVTKNQDDKIAAQIIIAEVPVALFVNCCEVD